MTIELNQLSHPISGYIQCMQKRYIELSNVVSLCDSSYAGQDTQFSHFDKSYCITDHVLMAYLGMQLMHSCTHALLATVIT